MTAVSEERTRTVEERREFPSLLTYPRYGTKNEEFRLPIPKSAGAIAKQIRSVLDAKYPVSDFDFSRPTDSDRVVDYQQRVSSDGRLVQIYLVILDDPRNLELRTVVVDDNEDADGNRNLAIELWDEIKQILSN